jgi:F-type H+-transporting ATPase subunit b
LRSEPSSWLTTSAALAALVIPISAKASELNLIPDAGVVATNVALFLLLIYPVNRLLVQPLLRVLDERDARTSGALEQSRKLGDEARVTGVDLESRLSESRARAQSQRSAILSDGEIQERAVLDAAREEASGIVEEVRQSVRSELVEARKALQTDARELAREAATRILGRAL